MLGNSKLQKIGVLGMALMMLLSSAGAVMAVSSTVSLSNSTAGETTTLNAEHTTDGSYTIDYLAVTYPNANLLNVTASDVSISLDTNNDGSGDTSIPNSSIGHPNDYQIMITSDGSVSTSSGDTVIVSINNATNPSSTGTYTVETQLNQQSDDSTESSTSDVTVESASTATPTTTDTSTPSDGTDTSDGTDNSTEEDLNELTFDVDDNDGNAIEGANFTISQDDTEVKSGMTDADGSATVSELEDGTYSITVNATDHKLVSQSVEISGDMAVSADLVASDSVEMSEMTVSEAGDGGGSGTVPTDNIMIIGAFAVVFLMISMFLAIKD